MSYKCVGIVCRKYPIRIRMCIDPIPKWKPPLRRFVLPSRMEFLATLEFRSCDNATDFHIFLLAKKKAPPPSPPPVIRLFRIVLQRNISTIQNGRAVGEGGEFDSIATEVPFFFVVVIIRSVQ